MTRISTLIRKSHLIGLTSTLGFLACTAALVSACGKDKSSPDSNSSHPPTSQIPVKNLSEAQKLAQQGSVTCQNSYECPSAVALLTSANAETVGMCTGFLLAPDLMATNSHCIPADLKPAGSNCTDRIWINFPNSGDIQAEQIECGQVLTASPLDQYHEADYAFIQLKTPVTRRTPFAVSRTGMTEETWMRVYKVNPIQNGGPSGSLVQTSCRTIRESMTLPSSFHDLSPVQSLADCNILHGNSGSPVLDEEGRVHGIVYGTIEAALPFRDNLIRAGIRLEDERQAPMGTATNLACVSIPLFQGEGPAAECAHLPPTPTVSPHLERQVQRMERKSEDLIRRWNNSHPNSPFQWTTGGSAERTSRLSTLLWATSPTRPSEISSAYIFPVPSCILAQRGENPSRTELVDSLNVELELPVWELDIKLNRYYRINYQLASESRQSLPVSIRYNPRRLQAEGKSLVTIRATHPMFNSLEIQSSELPVCPENTPAPQP